MGLTSPQISTSIKAGARLSLTVTILLSVFPVSLRSAVKIEESVLESTPKKSEIIIGYSHPDSIVSRMASLPLHAVEGLWRFASEGTLMAIERNSPEPADPYNTQASVYRMIIVRGADLSLRPGTVMGYLTTTAKRGVYDARIYTSRLDNGTTLSSPRTFTVTLTDSDSRLNISDYGKSLRFNWWRLLPYMYRHIFTRKEKSPGDIKGCFRVFPAPSIPVEPRYL